VNLGWRALPRLLRPSRLYGERVGRRSAHSLFVRHVDGGSSNVAEAELTSLMGPAYNLAGYGITFVSSPSHADVLLFTGPLTRNMLGPVLAAFAVMPEPKAIVTVGDWAASTPPPGDEAGSRRQLAEAFHSSYALVELPDLMKDAVVAHAAGDPPDPHTIIEALLHAAERQIERRSARWRMSVGPLRKGEAVTREGWN
jgi:membrane-bound hydrogenase subunit mbhJ